MKKNTALFGEDTATMTNFGNFNSLMQNNLGQNKPMDDGTIDESPVKQTNKSAPSAPASLKPSPAASSADSVDLGIVEIELAPKELFMVKLTNLGQEAISSEYRKQQRKAYYGTLGKYFNLRVRMSQPILCRSFESGGLFWYGQLMFGVTESTADVNFCGNLQWQNQLKTNLGNTFGAVNGDADVTLSLDVEVRQVEYMIAMPEGTADDDAPPSTPQLSWFGNQKFEMQKKIEQKLDNIDNLMNSQKSVNSNNNAAATNNKLNLSGKSPRNASAKAKAKAKVNSGNKSGANTPSNKSNSPRFANLKDSVNNTTAKKMKTLKQANPKNPQFSGGRPPLPNGKFVNPKVSEAAKKRREEERERQKFLREKRLKIRNQKRDEDNYEVSDKCSTDEDSPDRSHKKIPNWCQNWTQKVQQQTEYDPDSIFGMKIPNPDLGKIFGKESLNNRKHKRRGSSENWENDRLTRREVEQYKARVGQDKQWPIQ